MLVIRQRRGGKTLLHHACRRGHPSIVRFLVHAGCDVNAIDTAYNRFTPLLEAARAGHSSVCRFLVRNGAKSNHKDFRRRYDGSLGCSSRTWKCLKGFNE